MRQFVEPICELFAVAQKQPFLKHFNPKISSYKITTYKEAKLHIYVNYKIQLGRGTSNCKQAAPY